MKEILLQAGFTYHGFCRICSGHAELFTKGKIQVKIKQKQMKFFIIIGNNTITGKASELQTALEKYT